jgi:hypothetical protein
MRKGASFQSLAATGTSDSGSIELLPVTYWMAKGVRRYVLMALHDIVDRQLGRRRPKVA